MNPNGVSDGFDGPEFTRLLDEAWETTPLFQNTSPSDSSRSEVTSLYPFFPIDSTQTNPFSDSYRPIVIQSNPVGNPPEDYTFNLPPPVSSAATPVADDQEPNLGPQEFHSAESLKQESGKTATVVAAHRSAPQPTLTSSCSAPVNIPTFDGSKSFMVWLRLAKFYLKRTDEADRSPFLLLGLSPDYLAKALEEGLSDETPFETLCYHLANLLSNTHTL
ncbi:unnamed protein product [Dibothriocephalus latus]|uniref:Uncharacterized protein n=1 Tax=Dibothriocephalus latus TaxID=60516 RepID=A0A3P7MER3_DIBLA|nr:unnamed protein product [Dibothriocephalus latus]